MSPTPDNSLTAIEVVFTMSTHTDAPSTPVARVPSVSMPTAPPSTPSDSNGPEDLAVVRTATFGHPHPAIVIPGAKPHNQEGHDTERQPTRSASHPSPGCEPESPRTPVSARPARRWTTFAVEEEERVERVHSAEEHDAPEHHGAGPVILNTVEHFFGLDVSAPASQENEVAGEANARTPNHEDRSLPVV